MPQSLDHLLMCGLLIWKNPGWYIAQRNSFVSCRGTLTSETIFENVNCSYRCFPLPLPKQAFNYLHSQQQILLYLISTLYLYYPHKTGGIHFVLKHKIFNSFKLHYMPEIPQLNPFQGDIFYYYLLPLVILINTYSHVFWQFQC